jgi:hypothetical protein
LIGQATGVFVKVGVMVGVLVGVAAQKAAGSSTNWISLASLLVERKPMV